MSKTEDCVKEAVTINDIATVTGGQILTRVASRSSRDGKIVPVLMPKSISSGIIVSEDLGQAVLESQKPVKDDKYTRDGDVVVKLSTPFDSALVGPSEAGLLIPSFCVAIRIVKNGIVNAKYLTAFLNSSYARKLLALAASGTGKPMVKISDIRALKIPAVPPRDMEEIGEAFLLSCKKKAILRGMIRAEENIMENIVLASIKGGRI